MSFVFRESSKRCCSNCSTGVLLRSEGKGHGRKETGEAKAHVRAYKTEASPVTQGIQSQREWDTPRFTEPQAARLAACSIFNEEFFPNCPGLLLPPSYHFYILEVFLRLSEMQGRVKGTVITHSWNRVPGSVEPMMALVLDTPWQADVFG